MEACSGDRTFKYPLRLTKANGIGPAILLRIRNLVTPQRVQLGASSCLQYN